MFRFGKKPLCHKVQGMLSEYIDDCLDSEKKSLVERHLSSCKACSKEVESLRMTVRLLHRVPEVPAPRSFTITAPQPKREAVLGPSSLRWLRPATAVATIVLLVLVVGDFLNVFGHEAGTRGSELLNAPPGQTTTYSGAQWEGNLTDAGGNATPKVIPEPTPEGAGNVSLGNVSLGNISQGNASDESRVGVYSGGPGPQGPPSVDTLETVSWPLRQIEIAMGAVVFLLAMLTVFAVKQRRKGASTR